MLLAGVLPCPKLADLAPLECRLWPLEKHRCGVLAYGCLASARSRIRAV